MGVVVNMTKSVLHVHKTVKGKCSPNYCHVIKFLPKSMRHLVIIKTSLKGLLYEEGRLGRLYGHR